ncbi:hypothetical protein O0I10_002812 [Lichtheimia ornata]|uniref:Yeast cell wall synthesis Kre9/Knh1-like N-terminal domain-containing protein n=1 Tax=Lichtheimia ornata TaxID=688661 RepID=A0AAD7VB02_9FUNG|nr:uncharacterized protein O0I10_002812 [Lichtheimia ornata]KAJ8661545.1 hypothetical protein O0I10_002812 [Lichtheimia ornata]
MAPSYPDPGAIWTAGKQYQILWGDDGKSPSVNESWTNFKIDFMTGDNANQTFLTNVAKDLDGSKTTSYTWTAPHVDPYSAIYFFMFTNAAGETAWTTRFGIVAKDGDTLVPEQEKTQSTGEKIPWGNGKLVDNNTNTATNASTTSSTASSATASPASGPPAATSGDDTGVTPNAAAAAADTSHHPESSVTKHDPSLWWITTTLFSSAVVALHSVYQ